MIREQDLTVKGTHNILIGIFELHKQHREDWFQIILSTT